MISSTKISQSNLSISSLVLGMWHINTLNATQLDELLKSALEQGIMTFDHADIYGDYQCEKVYGEWIKKNKGYQDQIKLISKCGIKLLSEKKPEHRVKHYDTSAQHIIQSVENSLENLHADHLDLLLIHRPDPLMNPEEIAKAFDQLKEQGKVLNFGVSNFTNEQFELLSSYSSQPLITNQVEISIFHHELLFDGTLDYLMRKNIQPMAWSPLGGAKNIKSLIENNEVRKIADKYDVEEGNLILSWLLQHPARIIPVVGTMNPKRLTTIEEALHIEWDRQDWFYLLEEVRGEPVA